MKTTASLLPNFLIIGAAKSGTTALFNLLAQHPQIFTAYQKELYFFNNEENYARGVDWYLKSYFQKSASYTLRGEATPGYLFWSEKAAPRIQETYRDMPPKMIAILRDPVARAYSAYWHLVHHGGEELSFEDALAAEEERLQKQGAELCASGFIKFAYFRGGCYAAQLRPYLDTFPREQFLFLRSEDLYQHTPDTLNRVHDFLGIPPADETVALTSIERNAAGGMKNMEFYRWIRRRSGIKEFFKRFLPAATRYRLKQSLQHWNTAPVENPPINPATARMLREKYQDDIQLTEEMTGLDLSGWKKNA